jgi:hypothetical protein
VRREASELTAGVDATDLPSAMHHSELHYFTPNANQAQALPRELAWMAGENLVAVTAVACMPNSVLNLPGPGIYHGTLNWQSTSDNLVDKTLLFPYPSFPASGSQGVELQDAPVSMALTEFHFVLLYKDRLAGVSTLDEKLAYEEILPLVSIAFLSFWNAWLN